mmetsp:Transcript_62165/g.187567  ORF Transcript_62165/g.187567 Transcript_62165/m.187567 type:complete len:205 (+) Transcript_62165:258-872(+)
MGLRRSLRRRSRPALLALRQPSRWPPPPAERLCCGLPASLGLHPRMAVAGAHAEASLLWLSRRDADSTGKKTRMRSHSAICSAYSRNCRSSHRQSLLGSNHPSSMGSVDQSWMRMPAVTSRPRSSRFIATSDGRVSSSSTNSVTRFRWFRWKTYLWACLSVEPGTEKPLPAYLPRMNGFGCEPPRGAGTASTVRTDQHCSKPSV